jgi:hypothetical protein
MFRLSVRRINQLVKDGVLPQPVRGQYDLVACVQAYLTHLRARAGGTLQEERTLRERIHRERDEIELAILKNEYISKSDVTQEFIRRIRMFRADLLALPEKLPPGEARDTIHQAVIGILRDYARPLPPPLRAARG